MNCALCHCSATVSVKFQTPDRLEAKPHIDQCLNLPTWPVCGFMRGVMRYFISVACCCHLTQNTPSDTLKWALRVGL